MFVTGWQVWVNGELEPLEKAVVSRPAGKNFAKIFLEPTGLDASDDGKTQRRDMNRAPPDTVYGKGAIAVPRR